MTNKNILIISTEGWDHVFVSKHHYAQALSKMDNRVFFLNPNTGKKKIRRISPTLTVINNTQVRGIRFLPKIFCQLIFLFELWRIERVLNVKLDIIWTFDPSRFFDLGLLKSKVKIFHLVDWNQNFQRNTLAKTADLCLTTSDYLCEELKNFNVNTFNIGHGCNFPIKKNEIKTTRKKNIQVGYVGNLDISYIDWALLRKLFNDHQDKTFNLVGPISSQTIHKNGLDEFENCHTKGRVSSAEISSILQDFDILILAYKANEYAKQLANPHKVLEYLASGNVIVSTYTAEYEKHPELIEMTKTQEEFLNRFELVAKNLSIYNSSENREKRISFAQGNSYEKKIDEVDELLKKIM
ncbi:hypothetical protein [Ekhidna sp.]|uniref:hypothetical protein n=1 Tax=Ekhidna sp. TaxID=2608089 RepID=UPI0035146EBD